MTPYQTGIKVAVSLGMLGKVWEGLLTGGKALLGSGAQFLGDASSLGGSILKGVGPKAPEAGGIINKALSFIPGIANNQSTGFMANRIRGVMQSPLGNQMATGAILGGVANAAMAEPGDRMNAFAQGAGYGALGGAAFHGGSLMGTRLQTKILGTPIKKTTGWLPKYTGGLNPTSWYGKAGKQIAGYGLGPTALGMTAASMVPQGPADPRIQQQQQNPYSFKQGSLDPASKKLYYPTVPRIQAQDANGAYDFINEMARAKNIEDVFHLHDSQPKMNSPASDEMAALPIVPGDTP